MAGDLFGGEIDGEDVGLVVEDGDDGGLSGWDRVAGFPAEDFGFVGFLEDEGVDGEGGGGGGEGWVGEEDGAGLGDFLEGEGVKRVMGELGPEVRFSGCGLVGAGFGLDPVL